MQLPIDYRDKPFREKYLVFETPVLNGWIVFGQYENGTVGISDGDTEIFSHVPLDIAERLVAARNVFCQTVLNVLSYSAD